MLLSVVIPLLNEEGNLRELHRRVVEVCRAIGCDRRLIFVDDGSTDKSANVLRELAVEDATVTAVRLSRNFGHEAASTAGLDLAGGDAVVLMDADLQDPPEIIARMVEKWKEGSEIVYAVRGRREGETAFKRGSAWLFYRIINKLSDVAIPMDAGDFRLIDAKVLAALRRCREQDRFVRGLVAWAGFKTAAVEYDRPARFAGKTKYHPVKLLLLSLDAAIGFSIKPLRFATAFGFVMTLVSLGLVAVLSVQRIFFKIPFAGYSLLAAGLFFLGGVQMLMLGIAGEYIGRIYRQTQARPLYLVTETIGSAPEPRSAQTGNDAAMKSE